MTAWFEKIPERLEYELQALRDAGFPAQVDESARKSGRIVLAVKCQIKGNEHVLDVVFPTTYPTFPFQVFARSLSLDRHQDPYSKALCFIARIETEWRTDDTVAKYLVEKLPDILAANESSGPFEGERHEGAPVTPYLPFLLESVVLIGDWGLPFAASRGALELAAERARQPAVLLRAAVKQVSDERGNAIADLDTHLLRPFQRPLAGRWVRLTHRPRANDPGKIAAEAAEAWPALATPRYQDDIDVVGVVFPDEVNYRELQDKWIFLVRQRAGRVRPTRRGERGAQVVKTALVRAERAGRSDLQARIPRLVPLANRFAAVFGVGALGSTVAWQLARAGLGRLSVVDHDFVNAGTLPRWIYGISAAGRTKVSVMAERLQLDCPFLDVQPIIARLGDAFLSPEVEASLLQVLQTADAIIDCTVEKTVQHYLSNIAWERSVPYIWASGTPGGWGGIVGRIRPDRSRGCWQCFRGHLTHGGIREPQAEEGPEIQPVGCDAPTFRGAGFDMDQVAIMCARLAASTLCGGAPGSYGEFTWDVATVDLWEDGRPIAPKWTTYDLQRYGDCDAHN